MATLPGRTHHEDDRGFDNLYRAHVQAVYRYALAVLGDPADAEDVTQTTFLNAYRAFRRGERPNKPENWLITITHNVCRQRFRQLQRRPREVEFDEELRGAVEPDDGAPTADELRQAFERLPPNQRAALVMRELEGRSYDEIAGVIGVTVTALETLIFRARRSLREQLAEQLSCREAAFAISKQMDGMLSRRDARALRRHLRACPACTERRQAQTRQRRVLRGLLAVPIPSSLHAFMGHSVEVTAAAGGAGVAAKAAAVVAVAAIAGGGAYEAAVRVPPLVTHRSHAPAHVVPKPAAARVRENASAVVRRQQTVVVPPRRKSPVPAPVASTPIPAETPNARPARPIKPVKPVKRVHRIRPADSSPSRAESSKQTPPGRTKAHATRATAPPARVHPEHVVKPALQAPSASPKQNPHTAEGASASAARSRGKP